MHAGKTRSRFLCDGRERPHELFWAAESRKSGVAPAQFSVFLCVTFLILASFISWLSRDLCASQAEEAAEDEAEVGNSYLLQLLRPNSHRAHRRNFLVGLERPTIYSGHAIVSKGGVAPAQPGVLPMPKSNAAPRATFTLPTTSRHPRVTRAVKAQVIKALHARVTFPG